MLGMPPLGANSEDRLIRVPAKSSPWTPYVFIAMIAALLAMGYQNSNSIEYVRDLSPNAPPDTWNVIENPPTPVSMTERISFAFAIWIRLSVFWFAFMFVVRAIKRRKGITEPDVLR
jgi:hypothetical protein